MRQQEEILSDTGDTTLEPEAGESERVPAESHHKGLFTNVVALYGVQAGRKLIPLVSIPYLARVLGPAGWGTVAFVTALAEFIVILVEFGFNISATREVARHRDDPETCGKVMAGVLGSQAILASIGVAFAIVVSRWIPLVADKPLLLSAALFYAVAQGFAPQWFFQGLERMKLAAVLEVSGKLGALIGLFLLVKSPADEWKVLALGGIAPGLTTLVGLWLAHRNLPFFAPKWKLIRPALVMGWPMFLFRSAESLYGVGNAFLLGIFATPEMVGYFSAAEKISKAAFGLLNPVREAMFPRLSRLAAKGRRAATVSLARLGAMIIISGGLMLGVALFIGAPSATRILMGGEFAPAIAVLRILAVLPVLLAVTYSVGFQWLLPFGKDHLINRVILSAGVINVALSFLLARPFGAVGMAWAVVCAEAFVSVSLVIAVWWTWGSVGGPTVDAEGR